MLPTVISSLNTTIFILLKKDSKEQQTNFFKEYSENLLITLGVKILNQTSEKLLLTAKSHKTAFITFFHPQQTS